MAIGGSGTQADPWTISSADDLVAFAGSTSYWASGTYAVLTADINLTGVAWTPIGNHSTHYQGNFNGQRHVISNLTISSSDDDYQGLFGYVHGATIRNVGCDGFDITAGSRYVGGLVGYADSSASISNCYANGCTVSGSYYVGGLVGYADSSASISNCYANGCTVSGSDRVGGLVGYAYSASISNCYANGCTVSGSGAVGGLVGRAYSASISNCAIYGGTHGDTLIGYNQSSTTTNCYTSNDVTSAIFHNKDFWNNNEGGTLSQTYLAWDFANTWGWNLTDSIPALVANPPTISITTQPASSVSAYSQVTATASASAGSSGTLTYQWYVSRNSGSYSAISGQTTTGLTHTPTVGGTYTYKCVVTETTSTTVASASAVTNEVTVVVPTPTLTITTQPASQIYGLQTPVTATVAGTAVASGTLSFQWSVSKDGGSYTNVGSASSSNPNAMTYTPASTGTYVFRCIVTESTTQGTATVTTNSVTVSTGTITALTVSPTTGPTTAVITATVTLANVPTTDTGTVTFYVSTTPATSSSWSSVGNMSVGSQVSNKLTYTFTGSATAGTYYVKAVLSDTTQSVTYDSYSNAGLTNVTYTLSEYLGITAINLDVGTLTAGDTLTAKVLFANAPATDRGTLILWESTDPTNTSSDAWHIINARALSEQDSGTMSFSWSVGLPVGAHYLKATIYDATQGENIDSYTDSGLTNVAYTVVYEETPNVVQLNPAEFRLCDSNNRMDIVISQYESFEYTEVWGDADSFALTMKRSANHADDLLEGKVMIVPADQTHDYYRVLVILQISVDEDTVTATGRDYLWELLRGRVAMYGTGTRGRSSDVQSGVAETVARHYINVNCLEATDTYRQDSTVALEDVRDSPLGDNVEISAYMDGLDEIISSISTQGGINLYGALVEDEDNARGWYVEGRFCVGTDHSQDNEDDNPWVVLSEEYGNAKMTRFVSNMPSSTVNYIRGTYSSGGTVRFNCRWVGTTTGTGITRREIATDLGSCGYSGSYYANATARGLESLEDVLEQSIDFTLINTDMYGQDFVIGDILTCDAGAYGAYNLRLTEVTANYDERLMSISVSLGAEIPGVMSVIREARRLTPVDDGE